MRKRPVSILIVAVWALVVASAAFAQTSATTGEITGRVADATGGVLPGVTVTATNAGTGFTRTAVTGPAGTFNLGLLPPGTYRVEAQLSGFRPEAQEEVVVLLGTSSNVRLTLTPEVGEEITVTGEAPVVDVTETGLATSVTQQQISELPILGRDFSDLILLTPGANEAFGERVSLNGARGIQSDFNIDGAEANSDFFGEERGGTEAPFVFSQAAIQEFQVLRSTYAAEYGRGVGATLNAITKSGTNRIQGEAFYFFRDGDWADERSATLNGQQVSDFFEARDSEQYGFALGGPIVRDKVHFFVTTDFQDITEPLVARDVRTTDEFQDLSPELRSALVGRLEQLIGPLDRQFRFDAQEDQETYLAKIDANLATNHHLSLRHNYADYNNFPSEGSGDILSNNGDEYNTVNSTVLQVSSVLGSSLANELTLQYGLEERPINALNTSVPETVIQGLDFFTFGQSEFLPNRTDEEKWQIKNTTTWFRNNHQFKGGFEYLSTEIDNLFPRERAGQYFFSNVEDFLANRPNRLDQGFGPTGGLNAFDYETWGAFIQDTIDLGNVTLDVGIRYDVQDIPAPTGNAFPNHPEFVSDFNNDDDNWAPRLGVAWDVRGDGRSVLRGGVGKFYNFLPAILYAGPLSEISGLYNRISLRCDRGAPCPTYPNILTPEEFAREARASTNVTIVSPDLEAPESLRGSLAFEQQIGSFHTVSIEGVYAEIDKAQRLVHANVVPTGLSFGDLPLYSLNSPNRPYPDLGTVRQHVSDAEGEYQAVTLSARRFATGDSRFTWLAHYTWSEAIDQDSNERSTSTSFSLDPFNPELSEGRADYDVTHRFVASGTYRLPWDVQLSGILTVRSGTPYTAGIATTGFAGLNGLDFTGVNTPVFVDRNGSVIDLTLANGFTSPELAAFLAERGARMEERNERDQPSYRNLDVRLSKAFDFGRFAVEVIGEVFNVTNEEVEFISSSNQTMFTASQDRDGAWTFRRNASFGRANSFNFLSVTRQYQAALKFRF
jgi:hypothetical protein